MVPFLEGHYGSVHDSFMLHNTQALLSMVVLPDYDGDGAQREFVAERDKMKGILRRL